MPKRILEWFLAHLGWEFLKYFILLGLLPAIGGSALFTAVIGWWAYVSGGIPLPIIVMLGFIMFCYGTLVLDMILAAITNRTGMKIKFCDSQGHWLNQAPFALWSENADSSLLLGVNGFVRLTNLGFRERTIETAYIHLKLDGQELDKHWLSNFPIGERMPSLHTTPQVISIDMQINMSQRYSVTTKDLSKIKIELVIESTATRNIRHRFRNAYIGRRNTPISI